MRLAVLAAFLVACGKGVSVDCAKLQAQYTAEVPVAQSCDPAQPNQCTAQAFDSIAPSCTCCFTPVTPAGASALNQIYDQSKSDGCPGPQLVPCPAIIRLANCVADGGAGRCQ